MLICKIFDIYIHNNNSPVCKLYYLFIFLILASLRAFYTIILTMSFYEEQYEQIDDLGSVQSCIIFDL